MAAITPWSYLPLVETYELLSNFNSLREEKG